MGRGYRADHRRSIHPNLLSEQGMENCPVGCHDLRCLRLMLANVKAKVIKES